MSDEIQQPEKQQWTAPTIVERFATPGWVQDKLKMIFPRAECVRDVRSGEWWVVSGVGHRLWHGATPAAAWLAAAHDFTRWQLSASGVFDRFPDELLERKGFRP